MNTRTYKKLNIEDKRLKYASGLVVCLCLIISIIIFEKLPALSTVFSSISTGIIGAYIYEMIQNYKLKKVQFLMVYNEYLGEIHNKFRDNLFCLITKVAEDFYDNGSEVLCWEHYNMVASFIYNIREPLELLNELIKDDEEQKQGNIIKFIHSEDCFSIGDLERCVDECEYIYNAHEVRLKINSDSIEQEYELLKTKETV